MGHEISHALSRHGAERMAHQKMANIGIGAAGATLPGDRRERDKVVGLLSAGAKMGILKYGRDHESEADRMGLYLMASAGYDPRESVTFWERMQAKSGGGQQPEFLSTHPSHQTRIRDLKRWMPEAIKLYNASPMPKTRKPVPLPGG
jgi:predicted Zn-dependent protease